MDTRTDRRTAYLIDKSHCSWDRATKMQEYYPLEWNGNLRLETHMLSATFLSRKALTSEARGANVNCTHSKKWSHLPWIPVMRLDWWCSLDLMDRRVSSSHSLHTKPWARETTLHYEWRHQYGTAFSKSLCHNNTLKLTSLILIIGYEEFA